MLSCIPDSKRTGVQAKKAGCVLLHLGSPGAAHAIVQNRYSYSRDQLLSSWRVRRACLGRKTCLKTLRRIWVWLKIEEPGVRTHVLAFVSIYLGAIFGVHVFEPEPFLASFKTAASLAAKAQPLASRSPGAHAEL